MSTQFAGVLGPKQLTVKVAPKKGKEAYMVYIPRSGSAENRRVEIVFSKKGVEGLRQDFGEFIAENLGDIVGKWKKLEDGDACVGAGQKRRLEDEGKKVVEAENRAVHPFASATPDAISCPGAVSSIYR